MNRIILLSFFLLFFFNAGWAQIIKTKKRLRFQVIETQKSKAVYYSNVDSFVTYLTIENSDFNQNMTLLNVDSIILYSFQNSRLKGFYHSIENPETNWPVHKVIAAVDGSSFKIRFDECRGILEIIPPPYHQIKRKELIEYPSSINRLKLLINYIITPSCEEISGISEWEYMFRQENQTVKQHYKSKIRTDNDIYLIMAGVSDTTLHINTDFKEISELFLSKPNNFSFEAQSLFQSDILYSLDYGCVRQYDGYIFSNPVINQVDSEPVTFNMTKEINVRLLSK
jgi:hypothetical protein